MLHKLGCALIAAATFAALPVIAQEKKPNVVFILADNVGYGDLGPYGGGELRGAPTPRIDQLAREGLRLTQSGRARLHTIARGADDRAILYP
jgi:Sulfatase